MATNRNLANADVTAAYNASSNMVIRGRGVEVYSVLINAAGKGAGDTYTLGTLPKGATVIACNVSILEQASTACTLSVGIQSGTTSVGTELMATGDMNQAAGTQVNGAGSGLASSAAQLLIAGNTAATYLGAVQSAAVTAGKFLVNLTINFGC